jgi:plasmid stabilization system protein ParE
MPRKVRTSPEAARALAAARSRFRQPGAGRAAEGLWNALRQAPKTLRDHPYAGVKSHDHPSVRQLVVSGYRLIYLIEKDTGDPHTAGDIQIFAILAPGEP